MKAMILEGIEKLSLKAVPEPEVEAGGLLVQLLACGICRTDMKAYLMGQRDVKLPRVLGHEIVGKVVKDSSATGAYLGKRVQISPGVACGSCHYCQKGQDNLCNKMQIMGFHLDGGFAEYVAVPAPAVVNGVVNPLKKNTDAQVATLTEPLACALNMLEKMKLKKGQELLVIGGGTLGILTAMLGRHQGLRVTLSEIDAKRRKAVGKLLDLPILDTSGQALQKKVAQLTKGQGFAGVIPCTPGGEAFLDGIAATSKGGEFGFFSGLIAGDEHPLASLNSAHYKELRISGAYGCSVRHCRRALKLIEGTLDLKPLITNQLSLDELEKGIGMLRRQEGMKSVVTFR